VYEKRGEETRGWDSGSPDETTDGNYEEPERENASKSMPDGFTGRRTGSRDAGWTREHAGSPHGCLGGAGAGTVDAGSGQLPSYGGQFGTANSGGG
jgi:hypothetical protein